MPGKGMVTGPTKSRKVRTVPIERVLSAELARHLDTWVGEGPSALLFTGPRGNSHVRLNNWRRSQFAPAVRRALGSTMRVHDLRGTAITNWIETDGVSPMMVRSWVGHHSLLVTEEHYFGPTDDQIRLTMERVGRSMASALDPDSDEP